MGKFSVVCDCIYILEITGLPYVVELNYRKIIKFDDKFCFDLAMCMQKLPSSKMEKL